MDTPSTDEPSSSGVVVDSTVSYSSDGYLLWPELLDQLRGLFRTVDEAAISRALADAFGWADTIHVYGCSYFICGSDDFSCTVLCVIAPPDMASYSILMGTAPHLHLFFTHPDLVSFSTSLPPDDPVESSSSSSTADAAPYTYTTTEGEMDSQNLGASLSGLEGLGLGNSSTVSIDATSFIQNQYLETQSTDTYQSVTGTALNKLGVVTNRPKILMTSTYQKLSDVENTDLIPDAQGVVDSALTFSLTKQDNVINFISYLMDENPDLYSELLDISNAKNQRLYNGIEFIKQIENFKQDFLDSIKDFDSYGLQYIGYATDLDLSLAIRQMYYDLATHLNTGGYYLFNFTRGVKQTATAISNPDATGFSGEPRVIRQDQVGDDHLSITSSQILPPTITDLLKEPKEWSDTVMGVSWDDAPHGNTPQPMGYRLFGSTTTQNRPSEGSSELASSRYCQYYGNKYTEGIRNIRSHYYGSSTVDESPAATAYLCSLVFNELFSSYIISNSTLSNTNEKNLKYDGKNLLQDILGEAVATEEYSDLGQEDCTSRSITQLDNSKNLAQVLRYSNQDKIIMPFADPGVSFSSETESLTSGIESWIDPNIANIFEERDFDFGGLEEWMEKLSSIHSEAKSKIEPWTSKGNGQIVINEILRAVAAWASGELTEHFPQGNGKSSTEPIRFTDRPISVDSWNPPPMEDNDDYNINLDFFDIVDNAMGTYYDLQKEPGLITENRDFLDRQNDILNDTIYGAAENLNNALKGNGMYGIWGNSSTDMYESGVSNGWILEAGIPGYGGEDFINNFGMGGADSFANNAADGITGMYGLTDGFTGAGLAHNMGASSGINNLNINVANMATNNYAGNAASNMAGYGLWDLSEAEPVQAEANAAYYGIFRFWEGEEEVNRLSSSQRYFTRKMCYMFHLLRKLNPLTEPELFWYCAYQSVQAGAPYSDDWSSDLGKSIVNAMSNRDKSDAMRDDDAYQASRHMLSMLNCVFVEIEKNLCYDIAVLAKDSGFTSGNLGAYSESLAADVANSIFGASMNKYWNHQDDRSGSVSPQMELVFGSAGPSQKEQPTPITANTGLHHFQIRAILMNIAGDIARKFYDSLGGEELVKGYYGESNAIVYVDTTDDPTILRAECAKIFLPIVDNIDPSLGPVRWKITEGDWQSSAYELDASDFVLNQVVPSYAKEIVETGDVTSYDLDNIDENKEFQERYGLEAYGTEKITDFNASVAAHYAFLSTPEDFIPYTFVDDTEVPRDAFESDPLRGAAGSFVKALIYQREHPRRIVGYLDSVIEKYKSTKDQISGLSEEVYADDFFEIAQLHGVEIAEIIEYSALRQTFLREYIASEEQARPFAGYLPSNKILSSNLRNVMFEYIDQHYTHPVSTKHDNSGYYPNPEEGRIVTIGIPSGFIDKQVSKSESETNPITKRIICVKQQTTSVLNSVVFEPVKRHYWPSLFINNVALAAIDGIVDISQVHVQMSNYAYIDADSYKYVTTDYAGVLAYLMQQVLSVYQEIPSPFVDSQEFAEHIIKCHFEDFLMKNYLLLYGGLDTDETSFSVNYDSNTLYVDQSVIDNIDLFLTYLNLENADNILDGDKIVSFNNYYEASASTDRAVAWEQYTNFVAITQSRLFSGDQMTTKTLVPNIFERVFSFYTHMGELSFDLSQFGAGHPFVDSTGDHGYKMSDDPDAMTASLYCFDLAETAGSNSIVNDLNVQIYIDCSVLDVGSEGRTDVSYGSGIEGVMEDYYAT